MYTSLRLKSNFLTNTEPFTITMPEPHYIDKTSNLLDEAVIRRYYEYHNALTNVPNPLNYELARKTDGKLIPWNIMVPGVVMSVTRLDGKTVKTPVISGQKFKGMLRTAAFMISTEGMPLLDGREANYLAKGGLKNKKGQEDKVKKSTESPLARNRRLRAEDIIIGLFGAFDDRIAINSALRISDAILCDTDEMRNSPSIELDPSGARGDATEEPIFRERLKELEKVEGEKDRVKQRQIPFNCRVTRHREFSQKIDVVSATQEEIGLLFASLAYLHEHKMPVGGKSSVGNTGELDFDYSVYVIDEQTADETFIGNWQELRDDPQSIVAQSLDALAQRLAVRRAAAQLVPNPTTRLIEEEVIEAPKTVGRKRTKRPA